MGADEGVGGGHDGCAVVRISYETLKRIVTNRRGVGVVLLELELPET